MWQDVIKSSPLHQSLVDFGLHPRFTKRLAKNLYSHNKRSKGLWSAPFKWQVTDPDPNGTAIQENLTQTLLDMNVYALDNTNGTRRDPLFFPVNLLATSKDFGVASYPTFRKPCRFLQYPNIDLFYHVCDRARVLCSHIYLYRDVIDVIKSTTDNRAINHDRLEAIQLYSTHLQVIHSQLLAFPSRLIECLDYNFATTQPKVNRTLMTLLNFDNEENFNEAFSAVFRQKAPLTEAERQEYIPPELQAFMQSFVRLHEMVKHTCDVLKRQRLL